MDEVFVVTHEMDYEFNYTLAICSSVEKAREGIMSYFEARGKKLDYVGDRVWNVDSDPHECVKITPKILDHFWMPQRG